MSDHRLRGGGKKGKLAHFRPVDFSPAGREPIL
jgi:hypothetical protein